jgi:hypothetical protein
VRENKISGILPCHELGCPISRSFFARCGIPQTLTSGLSGLARFWGIELRDPTSRKQRARYGAPEFVAGRIPENLVPTHTLWPYRRQAEPRARHNASGAHCTRRNGARSVRPEERSACPLSPSCLQDAQTVDPQQPVPAHPPVDGRP